MSALGAGLANYPWVAAALASGVGLSYLVKGAAHPQLRKFLGSALEASTKAINKADDASKQALRMDRMVIVGLINDYDKAAKQGDKKEPRGPDESLMGGGE